MSGKLSKSFDEIIISMIKGEKLQKENNSENMIAFNMKYLRLKHDITDHTNFSLHF
jgi:hypothetical protein